MWACHVTSSSTYRNPFGATRVGGTISLSIDVFGCFDVTCTLRTWVDGKGEELLAMEGENLGNRMRFTTQLKPKEPQLIWYFFIIRSASGEEWRYGAQTGRTCGEGVLVQGYDPPSFQITVYRPRKKEPTWYTHGIAYQIFPDASRVARTGSSVPASRWPSSVAAPAGASSRTGRCRPTTTRTPTAA